VTDLGKFGKLLALVLVFWCAGTGCMLVSYATAFGTPVADLAPASSDGMRGAPSCHAQRQKSPKTAFKKASTASVWQVDLPAPFRSPAMSCCPLTSGSIAVAYRPQSHNPPALTNSESQILKLNDPRTAPVAAPMRRPKRVHSYLLDCAFLI
jgi:hypothetical protein